MLAESNLTAQPFRLREKAEDFLRAGGKRLRPALFRAVRKALGEMPDAMPGIEDAIECFHKASLVHDDIQDNSPSRYGRAALHVEYGIPAAIAVGDLLVAKGYRLIATCGHDAAPEMLAQTARSHERLALGQAAELLTANCKPPTASEASEVYRLKTGEGFALAAALGAISCGCGARIVDAALTYGREWGLAYQIADDLADNDGLLLKAVGRDKANELRLAALERASSVAAHICAAELGEWWK